MWALMLNMSQEVDLDMAALRFLEQSYQQEVRAELEMHYDQVTF